MSEDLGLLKAKSFFWYQKEWVQKEIAKLADGRESSFRYPEGGFSKRPQKISNRRDVLEMARQGATSFHVSEERWISPSELRPGMDRSDQNNLRYAWDFIIDIDSKDWTLSKVAAWIIIKVLKAEGIKSISCKFSGSKGFHIGIPFEAFPYELNGKFTRDMFPEWPKAIANYIIDIIGKNHLEITSDKVVVGKKVTYKIPELKELMKTEQKKLYQQICVDCGKVLNKFPAKIIDFNCTCGATKRMDEDHEYLKCDRCNSYMEKFVHQPEVCMCGSKKEPKTEFNVLSIIDVDTLLLSSRHMFRAVYSLHDKSGLVSIPIDPDKVLDFEKEQADPKNVRKSELVFLDREDATEEEGQGLLERAVEFQGDIEEIEEKRYEKTKKPFVKLEGAVPKKLFPPCIKAILAGMNDGKKRAMFILLNFLRSVGWSDEEIQIELDEWNKRNAQPLRQNIIVAQMSHAKLRKENILPPNCTNEAYYESIGVCSPDSLCRKVKNPVNYAKRKFFFERKKGRK